MTFLDAYPSQHAFARFHTPYRTKKRAHYLNGPSEIVSIQTTINQFSIKLRILIWKKMIYFEKKPLL
jgi:hypothetical protein